MKAGRVWLALDSAFVFDDHIGNLLEDYGAAGPYAIIVLFCNAKVQAAGGRVSMTWRGFRRSIGVDLETAKGVLAALQQEGRVEVEEEVTEAEFCVRVVGWDEWQKAGRSAVRQRWVRSTRMPETALECGETNGDEGRQAVTNSDAVTLEEKRVEEKRKQKAEPEGFEEWLGHHADTTSLTPPRSGTKARAEIAAAYAARRAEDYTLDELKLATSGAFGDPHRQEHGYFTCESVLRPTKVHDLIEKGRKKPHLQSVPQQNVSPQSVGRCKDCPSTGKLFQGRCLACQEAYEQRVLGDNGDAA